MMIHMMAGASTVVSGPIIHVNQMHENMNVQSAITTQYMVHPK